MYNEFWIDRALVGTSKSGGSRRAGRATGKLEKTYVNCGWTSCSRKVGLVDVWAMCGSVLILVRFN